MQKKFACTKNRWIAFSLGLLLPLIGMGLGVYLLTVNICINRAFVITHIALPLIAAALLALCLFSRMKRVGKVALSILVLILFAVTFLFSSLVGQFDKVKHYTGEEAAQHYTDAEDVNELMPSLSEIGEPVEIEYYNVYACEYIFVWDTDYLICRYDPEEYALQKKKLEEKYILQEDTMSIDGFDCEPSVEIDGYQFRVLSIEGEYEAYIGYPKYMVLIAYSDEANEIVYLSFCDTDLDYITSLQGFINDECGWNYVR